MKLDIGAGNEPLAGWQTVDLVDADYTAPMWCLPFADGSIDAIYTSHALEHIAKAQVLPTLQEWYRVLRPGAPVTIRVPDLAYCCTQYLEALRTETAERPVTGWNLDILFGNQEHPGQFHQTGFTKQSLTWYVTQAGFTIEGIATVWSHNQQTIDLYGRKP